MLFQFSVNNFKSIKDTVTFSMATTLKDKEKENFFQIKKNMLLQSAIIYGANASGKSNFLKAIMFMRRVVLNKDKVFQSTDKLPHIPFKLNSETENASSEFEIIFFIDKVKYRYGFELDSTTIYAEWLYSQETTKEAKLFFRDTEKNELYINKNKFKEGQGLKIAKHQLFIWEVDRGEGEISQKIFHWFKQLNFIDSNYSNNYIQNMMKKIKNREFKEEMLSFIKAVDFDIEDIQLEMTKESFESYEKSNSFTLNTYRNKYDKSNNYMSQVLFELDEESEGTRKFLKILAPIIDTLREGKILCIDELDASFHPQLTQYIIKLFHEKKFNKNNAQLIFTTHDTNLLTHHLFRRDQIWFVEKDQYGQSELYSLAQFKNVRKHEDFEKQYLKGHYGAVPSFKSSNI